MRDRWPAPTESPCGVDVVVKDNAWLDDDRLWVAVAHAVEHGCEVVPYSHAEPWTAGAGWEGKAMWTHDAAELVTIRPAGKRPRAKVRLSGPLWTL